MARTITVKGIGKASAKPDYVVLSMTLEAKNKDYQSAMDMAAEQIQHINDTLTEIGFEKGSVKTTSELFEKCKIPHYNDGREIRPSDGCRTYSSRSSK